LKNGYKKYLLKKKTLINNIPSFNFCGLVKKQIHQDAKILAPKKKNTRGSPVQTR
jgi:hypothetical protein